MHAHTSMRARSCLHAYTRSLYLTHAQILEPIQRLHARKLTCVCMYTNICVSVSVFASRWPSELRLWTLFLPKGDSETLGVHCGAVSRSMVLQCVAACCSVLQCVEAEIRGFTDASNDALFIWTYIYVCTHKHIFAHAYMFARTDIFAHI